MSHSAAPGQMHKAVTPSNTVNYPDGIARALYFGTTGDYTVVDRFGNAVLYKAIPAGFVLDMATIRVNVTGSTVLTDIVALF